MIEWMKSIFSLADTIINENNGCYYACKYTMFTMARGNFGSLIGCSYGSDTNLEWAALNFNKILTSRQAMFLSSKWNNKKVSLNALANRFFIINNQIPLTWFSMSI